jgi:hypothetical protein
VLYCDNNERTLNDKAKIVCYYQAKWHQVKRINGKTILGEHLPEVDEYNFEYDEPIEAPSQKDGSSGEENPQEKIDQLIRNSPIALQATLISTPRTVFGQKRASSQSSQPTLEQAVAQARSIPKVTMSTTTTQTAQTTTAATTAPAPNTNVQQTLLNIFDKGLNHILPGGGGGGGGGGGPALPVAAIQPIIAAQDVRAMGNKPENFWGDRTKAEEFIEEIKGYLRLNADVAGYNSPKTKAAFTLTCMKGSEVTGWVKNMGEIIEQLDPANNVPLFWDYFLQEFNRQYLDSTREDRARLALQTLRLKEYEMDAYIAKFEELARQADYTIGGSESIQLFKNGLSRPILSDVMRAPPVTGYNAIKERAIHSATAQRILDNQFGGTRNKPTTQTTSRPFFFSN